MSILQKFLANCKKPEGKFGAKIVKTMNRGHAPLSNWVFTICPPTDGECILDVGCGGGGNILRMLERYPNCRVDGIDYSSVSVECSRQILKDHADRCEVICADVAKLPFEDGSYDRVVSFESIYFWQNPVAAMQEISRVLKVICAVTLRMSPSYIPDMPSAATADETGKSELSHSLLLAR